MSDIFISYSWEDSKFVEALILALIEYGWSVWSDKSGEVEGRPFDEQIENAILESTVTLAVWSQASVKSRWVRAEAAFALGKDKLLPVIADNVDPPLQFLHIHSVNLADWNRTSNDGVFKKLAATLSERLDRVGRITEAETEKSTPIKAGTSLVDGIFAYWKNLRHACLPAVGPGFDEYFANRTFFIAQFTCVFGFFMATLFGLVDLITHSGVQLTFFRLLVTEPSLLILLALSFSAWAKRHSQKFVFAAGIVGLLLALKSAQMSEDTFPVTTGAAMSAFLFTLTVFMVLPLRTPNAVILSLLTLFLHEYYIFWTHKPVPRGLHAGQSICVLSAGLALVAVAYFRERVMRNSFLDYEQATAKNAELKERLMTLAAQRNQAQDRGQQSRGATQSALPTKGRARTKSPD